jgi:hypothetical protein
MFSGMSRMFGSFYNTVFGLDGSDDDVGAAPSGGSAD